MEQSSSNDTQPQAASKQHESEKMDAVGGLVAGVSHEINTPLGVNIANCSLLLEVLDDLGKDFKNGDLDAEAFEDFLITAQDLCNSMLKNMRRASQLISNFKRVAVKDTDESSQLEQVDVIELIQGFVSSFEGTGVDEPRSVQVQLQLPPRLIVSTYPAVLLQILTALMSNVLIHAKDPAKDICTVTISLAPAGDGYQLTFSDDGVGVPEADLKKVFEPFFTTKRGAGNPGLGLSIVYNTVKVMLRSDIHYESKPGAGFSVSFKLHNLMAE
ncbi:sensor histidine kinase [Halioxenophilus aromaticivorans]|uniref:histidine kinase n=1 Tax=Halioxenophilus aromaticivorans TaxID=1306992 RepID=A0AAV3TZJ6_9ALTE